MAIVTVPAFYYPTFIDPQPTATVGGTANILMNASGDKCAFVVPVPKSGTLDKAEFLIGAVGNNPDNGIRVSFQTVDAATGSPDGTQDQFRDVTGAPIPTGWTVPGLMTSDGTDLGSKRTVTAGEKLGIAIEFVTFVASDSISIATITAPANFAGGLSTYVADGSTGTYAKSHTAMPIVALKYDDGTYAYPVGAAYGPITALTATSYNNTSSPDEYAVAFQFPYTARVVGLWARADINDDTDLILYSGTTAERTISLDKDLLTSTVPGIVSGYFSSSYQISAATTYRIGLKPTTANNIQILRASFANTTVMDAMPPGNDWFESNRVDAGAWSDTTTNRFAAGLIIDGIDTAPSGGGSGGSFTFVG